jgi:hypothetical protein
MKTMISNLINGNLSDAKTQAKRYSLKSIADALQEHLGWSLHKAIMHAYFLKNQCTWQQACDVA